MLVPSLKRGYIADSMPDRRPDLWASRSTYLTVEIIDMFYLLTSRLDVSTNAAFLKLETNSVHRANGPLIDGNVT
jgi:hypothetical protein